MGPSYLLNNGAPIAPAERTASVIYSFSLKFLIFNFSFPKIRLHPAEKYIAFAGNESLSNFFYVILTGSIISSSMSVTSNINNPT